MSGGSSGGGVGVRFCRLNFAWLQPLLIFLVVTFVYVVYVGLNLLPALQAIHAANALSADGASFVGGGGPAFQSLVNDPHATRMSFTAFVVVTLGFHVLLIMFAASFIKAIVTPPGSVPVDKVQDKKVSRQSAHCRPAPSVMSRALPCMSDAHRWCVLCAPLSRAAEVGRRSVRHQS